MDRDIRAIAKRAMLKNGNTVTEKVHSDQKVVRILLDNNTIIDLQKDEPRKSIIKFDEPTVKSKASVKYFSPMPSRGNPFLTMGIFTTESQLNESIDRLIEEYIEV